jgi:triosephosphate isomerase (TIM)
MRVPLIAGNWKMHKTTAEAVELVEALLAGVEQGYVDDRQVLVCPPFTALYPLAPLLADGPIALGGQNMYPAAQGAFTGETSPAMLRDIGCQYVLIGHSERRQIIGETDEFISQKVQSAVEHGLIPLLCVGETKPQRDAGDAETVTLGQLRAGLGGLAAEQVAELVIAYEPVWAIGTGDTATPADAQAMHAAIRGAVASHYGQAAADAVRILYGGSVKPDNVDTLMAQPDIDGALVGGASLQAEQFLRIVHFKASS